MTFYTLDEVAAMLKVHRITVTRMIDAGRLTALRLGSKRGHYRITEAQFNAALKGMQTKREKRYVPVIEPVIVREARSAREAILKEEA